MRFIFLLVILALTILAYSQQKDTPAVTQQEDILADTQQGDTPNIQQQASVTTYFLQALQIFKEELQSPGLKTFGTQKQLNKLQKLLEQTNLWLLDHGNTAEVQDFDDRFATLLEIHAPIANRSLEYRDRDSTYQKVNDVLQEIYNKTTLLYQSHPNLSNKTQILLEKINATKQWIRAHYLRQKEKKLNQNIVFYNHQMLSKADQITSLYEVINNIANPLVEDQRTNSQSIDQEEQTHAEQLPTQSVVNSDL